VCRVGFNYLVSLAIAANHSTDNLLRTFRVPGFKSQKGRMTEFFGTAKSLSFFSHDLSMSSLLLSLTPGFSRVVEPQNDLNRFSGFARAKKAAEAARPPSQTD
jgi:hypothetical protein